jgi:hypothetical protein
MTDIAAAVVKKARSGGGACVERDAEAHEAKTQRCIGFAMSGAWQDQVNRPAATDDRKQDGPHLRVRRNAWLCGTRSSDDFVCADQQRLRNP